MSSICSLDIKGVRLLSEALHHICIGNLTLCYNAIGDEGLEHLLTARKAIYLEHLDVRNAEIGSVGVAVLSSFLQQEDI